MATLKAPLGAEDAAVLEEIAVLEAQIEQLDQMMIVVRALLVARSHGNP
jgi:hypothetical protein